MRERENGFTLIEVVVAMAVLLIGILAMAKIFPSIIKSGQYSSETTIAANLIQAKIEEVFYSDYANIDIGTIESKHRLSADQDDPLYDFQRETVVEYVDINLNHSVSDTKIKKITATVYWFNSLLLVEENKSASIIITEK